MPKPEPFVILDDAAVPEPRPELLERLRAEAQNARRNSPGHRTSRGAADSPKNLHYVSPMRRGESVEQRPPVDGRVPATSLSPEQTRPVSWIQTMQDPHFRKALTNIVAFGAFFLVAFLLITMGQDKPIAEPGQLAAANAPEPEETEVAEETPPANEADEEPAKTVALEPVVEQTPKSSTSQVTVQVGSPNRVTIEIDDAVYSNTEKVTLPLTPGTHRLKITKEGYEPYQGTFEVAADTDKLALPDFTLAAIAAPEKTGPAPIQVVSTPANAMILAGGEPTGYTTPATLPADLAKGSVSVRLDGYVIRDVVSERNQDADVLRFKLEPVPAPTLPAISRPVVAGYGFQLNEAENRSLASAVDKLLNADWEANHGKALSDAKNHWNVWGPFTRWDPRLDHAYGLVLWHHGEFKKAKDAMVAGVKREKNRPGQIVPYYPLYRDKIRLESVTKDEALAAEDLLDLIQDTTKTLKRHPEAGRDEAMENADFAGRLLAFLEGPSRAKLGSEVNLRLLHKRIEESFADDELRGIYQSARTQVQEQHQQEVATAQAQTEERDEKEEELQESGELGTTRINAKENRLGGRYFRSDYNAQNVTPYRIPDVTSAFPTDRGVGFSRGPAFVPFHNLLFSSGPAVSRSFVNNRTNDTNKVTNKVVLEELPTISFRRPHSLNTYMPQELERKRRNLLEAVSLADESGE